MLFEMLKYVQSNFCYQSCLSSLESQLQRSFLPFFFQKIYITSQIFSLGGGVRACVLNKYVQVLLTVPCAHWLLQHASLLRISQQQAWYSSAATQVLHIYLVEDQVLLQVMHNSCSKVPGAVCILHDFQQKSKCTTIGRQYSR